MSSRTLAEWLSWQEQLHPNPIDLGLERLKRVMALVQWQRPKCPIITVAGTNGKGSCVALLDSILSAGGYRVGTFTSPHLIRYNERIRIAGHEVSDASLIAAFERIDIARGDISLTFFEFNALAAFLIFDTAGLDAIVLEVGLGGRLDAANAVDADAALISSISLDHVEWLGRDVESIGREKAGIFRDHCPAIFGSRSRPASIVQEAQRSGATLFSLGVEFDHTQSVDDVASWNWRCADAQLDQLPFPALFGSVQLDNAAAALTTLHVLRDRLPLTRAAIATGLRSVSLPGRFQVIATASGEWLFDVAHNPAAAETLARNLAARPCVGRTIAICGMFADKDSAGVIAAVNAQIDEWVVAGVTGARALSPDRLTKTLIECGATVVQTMSSVQAACEHAQRRTRPQDRVIVFGSFHTVGPALEWIAGKGPQVANRVFNSL